MSFGIFQFRRGTAAQAAATNIVLLDGELGLETDTRLFKIGDGVTPWNSLPYGGIKGDAGNDATVQLGVVQTGAPGSQVVVTNSGNPQNAIFNFSIPRGDTGATGDKGWSPVLATVIDGERRVLRLVDYVDGQGAKPTIPTNNYIGSTGLTNLAGAVDVRGAVGQTGPAVPLSNATPQPLGAATPGDSSDAARANHVHQMPSAADVGADPSGTAAALVEDHASLPDAHPQYLSQSEGDARYVQPAQLPPSKLSAKISTLFASPANSTAVTVVLSLVIPANYLTAGKCFDIDLEGTQSQSAAATNVVGAIFVNNTQLVSAAVAGGIAAQTNRSIRMKGGVMWNGSVFLGNITTGVSGVLPVGNANVTGVAAAANAEHTISIRVQTSTANAANIIRAMVAAIKEI